ncbi:hypothetical protein FB451DRAFT_1029787 [Mycena latifolia]|nr:hypothetical protein FB451DRAFT_1029787 [Mycena latifolia]
MGRSLYEICIKLADSIDFYGRRSWLGERGDVPMPLDEGPLRSLLHTKEEAQLVIERARKSILSLMGFIACFQSLISLAVSELSEEQRKLVKSLYLEERPKAGVLYKLNRDYHEVSVAHLLRHGVAVHYVWTDDEKNDGRFLRLSPEFWNEYSGIRGGGAPKEVDLALLPSYADWREDLERYDWCFQDLKAGKMGSTISGFKPYWIYRIVDHRLFGARTLTHWNVIRAYSERFKGTVAETPIGTVCTFFRQNPIRVDEPSYARIWPHEHRNALTDFAKEPIGEEIAEGEAFFESSSRIREQVKNRWAPRPGRTFSSLMDRLGPIAPAGYLPPMSPTRRSEDTADMGLTSKWSQQMAAEGSRRRDARSLSPLERESRESSVRLRSSSPVSSEGEERVTPVHVDYHRRFRDEDEALQALNEWAPSVVEMDPRLPPFVSPTWNLDWLSDAILYCEDPRSVLRMKALPACNPSVRVMEDVLELAVRFGIPFQLFIRSSRVTAYTPAGISPLTEATQFSVYEQGFNDLPLSHGVGGPAATYGRYLSQLNHLLARPNAVAFIGMGGVLRYVAELYNADIIQRFLRGPSLQLSYHNKGASLLVTRNAYSEFYVTDEVSHGEVMLLLGHIPHARPGADSTLWPPPEIMESDSPHMTGYISSGVFDILENLKNDLVQKKKYKWRTAAEWKEYFRVGGKGDHAPAVIPTDSDFDLGAKLFARSYPKDWSNMEVSEIEIPEKFDSPPSRQD